MSGLISPGALSTALATAGSTSASTFFSWAGLVTLAPTARIWAV